MKLADIVDALVAAGCTGEQIAAAVRAAGARDDERTEARRAQEREKKARYRAKLSTMSANVHVDTQGTDVDMVSLKESSPQTPFKENTLPFVNPETARARGSTTKPIVEVAGSGPVVPAIAVPTVEAEFEEFWRHYPHRVGKPEAFKAFIRARTGERVRGKPQRKPVPLAVILEGVANYTRDKPPDHNWLNPSTFLNQERYADEPAAVTGKRRDTTTAELSEMLAQARFELEREERPERDPRREIAYGHG